MKKRLFMFSLTMVLLIECGFAFFLLYRHNAQTESSKNNSTQEANDGDQMLVEEKSITLSDSETTEKKVELDNIETVDSMIDESTSVDNDKVEEQTEASKSGLSETFFETTNGKNIINKLVQSQTDYYAFQTMDASYRNLYAEILYIVQNLAKNIKISSTNQKTIDLVFQCVLSDHPELYYIDGYSYTTYTQDDKVVKILLSGNYTKTKAEIEKLNQQIENAVMVCISGINKEESEYAKVKYIYEYLVKNTTYDLNSAENQNIISVFIYGNSVCQGYAKAMQYLLNRLGIFATLVVGTVDGGVGHAWNLVKMDGNFYYVDSTWGDAFYVFDQSQEGIAVDHIPSISYDYLGVTTEQLTKTHQIDNPVSVPWCVALEDNYYVRENAYFTEVNPEQLKQVFQNGYAQGKVLVTLKCENETIFDGVLDYLIYQQKIFDFLTTTENSVAYADSREQLSLTFWLK